MSSEIKADKWSPASGTSGTIGDSGDTFTVPSGVTLDTSSSTLTLPSTIITSQTEKSSLVDADKFLISDSAASGALKYVQKSNLGAGSFTLVKTENVTSATSSINVESVFSTTYDTYLVSIYRYLPSSDGGEVRIRFLTGTNTEVSGANYDYAARYFDQDGAVSSNTGNNGTYFRIADSIDNLQAQGGFNASLWFNVDKNNSGGNSGSFTGTAQFADASGINHSAYVGGYYQDATSSVSPTGLRFEPGTGNITSTKISVYGVTK